MSQSKRKGGENHPAPGPGPRKKVKTLVEKEKSPPADDNDNDESPIPPNKFEPNEMNPFLLGPVMKLMMSQLTIEDLKRSRGVCQLWDHDSTIELQKLTSQMKPQKLAKAYKIQNFVKTLEDSPNKVFISHTIESTLQTLSAQRQRFYQQFEPKSLILKIEKGDTKVILKLQKILQNASKFIKELRIVGKLIHRQFGGKISWPKSLKFSQLEELRLDLEFGIVEINDVHFILENVIKNAPRLKSLRLVSQPIDRPLCNLLTSHGLIANLDKFEIVYGRSNGGVLAFAQDLLDMALAGLKLSKFCISVTFEVHLTRQVILGHLEKLKEFLTTQSDTLVSLDISICYRVDYVLHDCNFNMPLLPKLKFLDIGNGCQYTSLITMDLPLTTPNLREININLKTYQEGKTFKGSLDSVEKLIVTNQDSLKDFHHLKNYFPHIVELEVDHLDKYNYMPWENTLKKLTIHPPKLRHLKFDTLSQLKVLHRLELIKRRRRKDIGADLDVHSLSRTNVKSLKIHNYMINVGLLKDIRSRFTLDYLPPNPGQINQSK